MLSSVFSYLVYLIHFLLSLLFPDFVLTEVIFCKVLPKVIMERSVTMLLGPMMNIGLMTWSHYLSLTGDIFMTFGRRFFPSYEFAMLVRIHVPNASF